MEPYIWQRCPLYPLPSVQIPSYIYKHYYIFQGFKFEQTEGTKRKKSINSFQVPPNIDVMDNAFCFRCDLFWKCTRYRRQRTLLSLECPIKTCISHLHAGLFRIGFMFGTLGSFLVVVVLRYYIFIMKFFTNYSRSRPHHTTTCTTSTTTTTTTTLQNQHQQSPPLFTTPPTTIFIKHHA